MTHPVDELLRAAAGDPQPTTDDVIIGRRRLLAAMEAEAARSDIRVPTFRARRRLAVATAFVLVVAVAVATNLVRTSPVTALGDLAVVAERAPIPLVSEGEFAYSVMRERSLRFVPHSDLDLPTTGTVAYLLPTVRERWVGSDGSTYLQETVGTPEFFSEADRLAYENAGYATTDGIGEPSEGFFTPPGTLLEERLWSTDAEALLRQMRATSSGQVEGGRSASIAFVELAINLLTEPLADPALRAATIEAIELSGEGEVTSGPGGNVTYSIEDDDAELPIRIEVEFDDAANLIRHSQILLEGDPSVGAPPGTPLSERRFSEFRTVSELGGT